MLTHTYIHTHAHEERKRQKMRENEFPALRDHYCKLLCLLCTVPDVTRSLVITVTVADLLSSRTPIAAVPAATSMSESVCVWHHPTEHPLLYIFY